MIHKSAVLGMLGVLVVISSVALVSTQWAYPVHELFAHDAPLIQLAKQYEIIATMMVALLAGGILSVASLLLQQIIGNTLASDTTLAVGSGANMTMMLVALFLPNLGLYGSFWVAMMGALLSIGATFLLSLRSNFNPITLMLSGLMINILLYAIANLLLIFFSEMSLGLMMWSGGILTQSSLDTTYHLGIIAVASSLALMPLIKPLTLMGLDDSTAKSLGVSVQKIRLISVMLVAIMVATVVSQLGVLSFAGLAGATLANALSIHHVGRRLAVGFVAGGLLLWLTSNVSALLSAKFSLIIPAGAMSGILGAPIIIYLILKQKNQHINDDAPISIPKRKPINVLAYLALLVVITIMALTITPHALGFGFNADMALIGEFRLSRTLGALSVGAMLAIAGTLLQRLTQNPMASPEVLGVSGGSALGVVAFFVIGSWLGLAHSNTFIIAGGVLGALAVLGVILWLSSRLSHGHLLLVGVAISALTTGVMTLLRLSGDPRLQTILTWLSGSTYHLNLGTAMMLCVCLMMSVIITLVLSKTVQLISLGDEVARGRGVSVRFFYGLLLFIIAILSAIATLAMGPLSFVGLVVPHLAISMGATTLTAQLRLSALLGAMLLVVADYVGRYVIFPYEIPAGTLSAIVGAGYFVYLTLRKK